MGPVVGKISTTEGGGGGAASVKKQGQTNTLAVRG